MEAVRRYVRRPRRKLRYPSSTENASKKECRDRLSMGDVDRLFDDLDSPGYLLHLGHSDSDNEEIQASECASPPKLKAKPAKSSSSHPATHSPSPGLSIDHSNGPFQEPLKTSSPLEESMDGNSAQTQTIHKSKMPLLIFSDCEKGKDAATIRPASDNHNERPAVHDKNLQMQSPSKSAQPETSVSTAEKDNEGTRSKSTEESLSPAVKKDLWVFLQNVQDFGLPKNKLKALTPVKAPTPPPELEDDFLIMGNDAPSYLSIPTKLISKQRDKESKSRMDRGSEDSLQEEAPPSKTLVKEQTARKQTAGNTKEKKNKPKQRNTLTKNKKADDLHKVVAGRQTDDQRVVPSSEVKKSSKVSRDNPMSSRPSVKEKKMTIQHQKPSTEEWKAVGQDFSSDFDLGKPDPARCWAEQNKSFLEECQVSSKRKRKPPGEWWVGCPENAEQTTMRDTTPLIKKPKANLGKSAKAASVSLAKATNVLKSTTKKAAKKTKGAEKKKSATGKSFDQEQPEFPDQDSLPSVFSPLEFVNQDQNRHSEQQVCQRTGKKNVSIKLIPSSPSGSPEQLSDKRQRRPPGEWWKAAITPEKAETEPLLNLTQKKPIVGKKTKAKQNQLSPRSAGRATIFLPRPNTEGKEGRKSVNATVDLFTSRTLPVNPATTRSHQGVVQDYAPNHQGTYVVDGGRSNQESLQDNACASRDMFQSGPVSMIDLETHDDADLPSSRHPPAELSVSDLCAPPLRPCTLRARDKTDLTEWLQFLFPTTLTDITVSPDHFNWYFHKSGTMGIMEDLHCWNFSTGKMLLGSFMKKPLWVDHSAAAVFFLLTSSVKVIIDNTESYVHAGSYFMVPCGHPYSIQNLSEQRAFLCYNRMLAESPD